MTMRTKQSSLITTARCASQDWATKVGATGATEGNGAVGATEEDEFVDLKDAVQEDKDEKEETEELSGADGEEETTDESGSTQESDEGGSENNDISWSETLQKAKENLEEKIEKGDEVNELPLGTEGSEEDRGDDSSDGRDIQSHELSVQGGSEQNDT